MKDIVNPGEDELVLRNRLKEAVRATQTPAFLEARIRNAIAAEPPRRVWWKQFMPAAAALALLVVSVGVAYQLGNLRLTTASQESYIASVTGRVATLMRVGLGDHIHCSVFRKYPKNAPKVEELASNLGPRYKALVPIVQKHVPKDFQLMIAHVCAYHDRKFLHLSMKGDSNLMSLVIVRKKDSESFRTEEMLPALTQSGIPIYKAGAQKFQIASFETEGHLVYLISDLRSEKNLQMMLAMAPSVKEILEKAKS
jgi:hypothetical protein